MKRLIKYSYLNLFIISSMLAGMEAKKKIIFPGKVNFIVEGTKNLITSIKKEKDKISFNYDNDKFIVNNNGIFIFTNLKKKRIYEYLLKIRKEIPQDIAKLIAAFSEPIYSIYIDSDDRTTIVEELNQKQEINMKKNSCIDITLEDFDSLESSRENCLLPIDYTEAIEFFDEEDQEVSYFYPQVEINIIFDEKNKKSRLTMYSTAMPLKEVQKYYSRQTNNSGQDNQTN